VKNLKVCKIFEDGQRLTLNQPQVRHAGRKIKCIKKIDSTKPNQTTVILPDTLDSYIQGSHRFIISSEDTTANDAAEFKP